MLVDAHAFIKIRSGSFVDENCKEFFFSGYNTWQVIHLATSTCVVLTHTLMTCATGLRLFNIMSTAFWRPWSRFSAAVTTPGWAIPPTVTHHLFGPHAYMLHSSATLHNQ